MDATYDFRKGATAAPPQLTGYNHRPAGYPPTQPPPPYNRIASSSSGASSPGHSQPPPFYPRIGQPAGPPTNRPPPPVPTASASAPQGGGNGIRVVIKPEYQVAAPAQLQPPANEVPRSLFQFDFEFERRLIQDLESGAWPRGPSDALRQANGDDSAMPSAAAEDPVVAKYVAMGLNKEAVAMGVATFGDVQNKVVDFCPVYMLLREMGFPSEEVAGVLHTYDNDEEKALAHFLNQ